MPALSNPPQARKHAPDFSTDGARWPNRNSSFFHQLDGHIWHVQRRGSGPVVCLIHGAGAATHSWNGLFQILSEHFDTIAMDLPGLGFTQSAPNFQPSLANVSAALRNLLEDLEAAPSLLIGHSAGAAIALTLADRGHTKPDRIVSINGALRPFEGTMGVLAPLVAKGMTAGGLAPRIMAWSARDQNRVARLLRDTGSNPPETSLENYTALLRRPAHIRGTLMMMAHWQLRNIQAACQRLAVPMLFMAGTRDKAVPPELAKSMSQLAPKGRWAELDELGHLAHEEAPERVAEQILRFVT